MKRRLILMIFNQLGPFHQSQQGHLLNIIHCRQNAYYLKFFHFLAYIHLVNWLTKLLVILLPLLFIFRVMVTRVASICRAVIRPDSRDLSPYSPWVRFRFFEAFPFIRPVLCFLNFVCLGLNIIIQISYQNTSKLSNHIPHKW